MRDLGVGFGYLLKGQRWVARHGRQYGFGLLPGLITLVLYAAALVALAVWGEDAVTWATPFADDWSSHLAGPVPRLPDRRPLRPRPAPGRADVHRRHPAGRASPSTRTSRRRSTPTSRPTAPLPRSGPPALARAVDLGPGQPARPGPGRPVGRAALRARVPALRRADRRPRDRLLRHWLLPHRGTRRRGPAAPGRRPARPAQPAPLPQRPWPGASARPWAWPSWCRSSRCSWMPGAVAGATLLARDLLGEESADDGTGAPAEENATP